MTAEQSRTVAVPPSPGVPALLDFEARQPWGSPAKEHAILVDLGMRPARYYQLLNAAIQTREALEHDPELTHRLLRLRATLIAQRATTRPTQETA